MSVRRQRAAYHHAGHAVFAYLRHVPFNSVRLAPSREPAGEIDLTPAIAALTAPETTDGSRRRRARRLIDVALAGAEAERLTTTEPPAHAMECASCRMIDAGALTMAGQRDAPDLLSERRTYVARIVPRRASAVRLVADALLTNCTLTSDEVRELVWRAKPPSRIGPPGAASTPDTAT